MSRAEYTARINRVIDHIGDHLEDELHLADLARIAAFSRFHFHRIFTAHTNETLKRFIQRLRLERAASQLHKNPGKSITEIALDCGFSSSATFARAFKSRFAVSATEWRQKVPYGTDSNPGKMNGKDGQGNHNQGKEFLIEATYLGPRQQHWRVEMKGNTNLEAKVTVRTLPAMHVAYLRHIGPYQGDPELFGRLWEKMCRWAGPRGLLNPPKTQMLCVYEDDPNVTKDEKLRLDVCITIDEDTPIDGEFGKRTLRGGEYAVAHFELLPHQYGDAWNAVYGGWLPQSGYQPDDRPAFELMLGSPEQHPEGKHVVEICVPVRPL
ncbi:MAG: AraC family transcriptional regulator [Proteobacteria bacterium]|nr:AraC family transcriptional regulator [Pseudomonadota bacterium]